MSLILPRRRLLLGALAAPAIIRPARASMDWLDGFPGNLRQAAYPDYRASNGRKWNTGNSLARGLQFGLVFRQDGPLQGWDFVNELVYYSQNTGTTPNGLGGVSRGYGLRFTSASSGYLQPSVNNPAARVTAAYATSMLGAISLVFVGNWPVGAASTGDYQTLISVGNNNSGGYYVAYDFTIADTMRLYRAGTGGAAYYTSLDNGAGAGSEYSASQLTTLGVSQDGVFPGGTLKFYRAGKYTGSSSVTHDMSSAPAFSGGNVQIGRTGNNSGSFYGYFNGTMSMAYGYNRVLTDAEFLAIQLDPWWALRMDQTPAVASYYPGTGAVPSSRGIIIQ